MLTATSAMMLAGPWSMCELAMLHSVRTSRRSFLSTAATLALRLGPSLGIDGSWTSRTSRDRML